MPLSEEQQAAIRAAVEAGRRVAWQSNGTAVLRMAGTTRSRTTIANFDRLTEAGHYYFQLTGEHVPIADLDMNQIPERAEDGNTEYIRDRRGTRRVGRVKEVAGTTRPSASASGPSAEPST